MNIWYQQMLAEARELIKRFVTKKPANFVEAAVFSAIREIIATFGDSIQQFLDRMRGVSFA